MAGHTARASRAWQWLAGMAVLLTCAAPASAQTVAGSIQGTVTDTTGSALPGVAISIRHLDTGAERDVVTNERGLYAAPLLPIGRYRLTATLSGFGPVVQEATVTLNATIVADFRLDPAISTEVRVTAEPPRINAVNQQVTQSLTAEQIEDKPIPINVISNNTFLTLAETFAGFNDNPTAGQNIPTSSSGSSINFNGTGSRGATFQIDGVNNDDSSENQHRQGVTLAAIKEFQVISNSYTAEFGRGYGAVVLVQTKSGTNDVHGEINYTRQDSRWNALPAFATVRPQNSRPNYAGVAGFPLVRNTLFGFVSAERGRWEGTQGYARDIITAEDLALPRLTRGNDTPANRAFQDAIIARFAGFTPNDPRSNRTFQTTQGFDWPTSDSSLRLDWNAGEADRFTARYQYSRQRFTTEDIIPGENAENNNRQANIGLTWTRVLSQRTVGEFRYGLGMRDTNVNILAGNDTPIVRFAGSPVSGSIIGNAGVFPIARSQTDHQFVYNLTTMFGEAHSLKAGTDIRFSALDDHSESFGRGFWSFNANCGGVVYSSSYAAFMDGCVTSFTKGYGPFSLENRIDEYNVYLEDSWQATANLVLNLGLRYEFAGAAREASDLIDYGYGDDADNLEPRLGFAWTPNWGQGFLGRLAGEPGRFVVRGGYGLFHGRIFQSVFSQGGASLRLNPPHAIQLGFTTLPNILSVADPSLGFVFTPGPQNARHAIARAHPDLEMPATHQWNVSVERTMPWTSTLRVTYSAARGVGLLRYAPENLAVTPAEGGITVVGHPNNAPAAGAPDLRGVHINSVAADYRCAGTGFIPGVNTNAACPNAVPIADNEISLRVPRINERRPDPRHTSNLVVSNDAESWYHGLQTEWQKRLSGGLWFTATYTWSKAVDNTSEATFVGAGDSNALGPDKNFAKGRSRFHTPHRFALTGAWELPILRDRRDLAGVLLGGWQVAGTLTLSHGTPFTVVDTGGGDITWDGFSENRPVLLDPSLLGASVDDPDTSESVLRRDAFARATPDDYGRLVGRNTFYGDGVRNVDLALSKAFPLVNGHRVQVRIEAFNVFDNIRWAFPNTDFASANFGRITAQANAPRSVQFHVRYVF